MRRLLGLFGVLIGLLLPSSLVESANARDNYGPGVATQVDLAVEACHDGNPVEMVLAVAANSGEPVTGRLGIKIVRVGEPGPAVYEHSVAYAGGQKQVTGPVIDRPGDYLVRAVFVPKRKGYLKSRTSAPFEVPKQRCPTGIAPADDNRTEGLPDTGGPSLWLLLAGVALVGGGTATTARARGRRRVRVSPATR